MPKKNAPKTGFGYEEEATEDTDGTQGNLGSIDPLDDPEADSPIPTIGEAEGSDFGMSATFDPLFEADTSDQAEDGTQGNLGSIDPLGEQDGELTIPTIGEAAGSDFGMGASFDPVFEAGADDWPDDGPFGTINEGDIGLAGTFDPLDEVDEVDVPSEPGIGFDFDMLCG